MNIFKKFMDYFLIKNSDDENGNNSEMDINKLKSLSPEEIDMTEDDELDYLIIDHIDALIDGCDDYIKCIKSLSEVRKNCYILSEVDSYAFAGTLDDFIVYNFDLRNDVPNTLSLVGLDDLARFFQTLNDFINEKYNGRLPFPVDEEFESYPEYEKLIKELKPFDEAFEKLVDSNVHIIEDKLVEYIRANRTQFV